MTRYLITGADGMLGSELRSALADRDVLSLGRSQLDITDPVAVAAAVRPGDTVINCAAYTNVDAAETDEATATAVNGDGPANIARAAARVGARLVQVSTDYVFDGTGDVPLPEGRQLAPISAYGRSKAAGEAAVLREHPEASYIVRTAWLYGAHGSNFGRTMLRLAGSQPTVSVVADQVGQPTWARDVAALILRLLDGDAPVGIYHATNSGQASWFDYARELYRLHGLDPERVQPTESAAFRRPAPRPAWSVLGHDAWAAAGLPLPRPWQDALAEAASRGVFPA